MHFVQRFWKTFMPIADHGFSRLRREIRHSAKQFQKPTNDQDKAIFGSAVSLEYAYAVEDVEEALNRYEEQLPELQQTAPKDSSMEAQLFKSAQEIVQFSSSMEARDLARTVCAYFAITEHRRNTPWPTLQAVEDTESSENT